MNAIAITPYHDTRTNTTRYFDQYMNEYDYNPALDGVGSFFDKINPFKKKEGGTTVGNFLRKIKDSATRVFSPDPAGNPGQEIPTNIPPYSERGVTIPTNQANIAPPIYDNGEDKILGMPKKTAMIVGVAVVAGVGIYLAKRNK